MSTVEAEPVATIKGRWGYYAITYEQFLKLKELCKRIRKHVATTAAANRWRRKDPQNRVHRPLLRNAQNQPIGRAWPGTPTFCPDISHPTLASWEPVRIGPTRCWLQNVLYLYTQLRRPSVTPEGVPSVPAELLSQLDQVLEETGGFVRPS